MSAHQIVLGFYGLFPLATTVADTGDGFVNLAKFAQIFDVIVHLLIGDDRQGLAIRELAVFVLIQYPPSERIDVDGKPIVCLLGSDVQDVSGYVRLFEVGHIGITQAGKGAEAEEVSSLGQCARVVDHLLILYPFIRMEFDLCPVCRNLIAI